MSYAEFESGALSPALPEAQIVNFTDDPEQLARATYAQSGMGRWRRRGVGDWSAGEVLGHVKQNAVPLLIGVAVGWFLARRKRPSVGAFSPFAMNPRRRRGRRSKRGKRRR